MTRVNNPYQLAVPDALGRRATPRRFLPGHVFAADFYAAATTTDGYLSYPVNGTAGYIWGDDVARCDKNSIKVLTFTSNIANDYLVTGAAHDIQTGCPVYLLVNATGVLPAATPALAVNTLYYASRVDGTTIRLHLTQADALADTNRIDITGNVTATCYVVNLPRAVYLQGDGTANVPNLKGYLEGGPLDLTLKPLICVDFSIVDVAGDGSVLPKSVTLALNTDAAKYRTFNMLLTTASVVYQSPGRYRWYGTMSQGTDTGAFNIASVDFFTLSMARDNGAAAKIVLDRVMFGSYATGPSNVLYCPTFDDGYWVHRLAAARLAASGLRGCFFMPTAYVGTAGRLSWTQLGYMRDMDHLICNHAHDHATWLTMTAAQRLADYRRAVRLLQDNGFANGSRIFRAPNGYFPAAERAVWQEREIELLAETTKPGQGDTAARQLNAIGDRDPQLSCVDLAATEATMWTRCKADGGLLVSLYHAFNADATWDTFANFSAQVASVAGDVLGGTGRNMSLSEYARGQ